jgi:hypothetical protein
VWDSSALRILDQWQAESELKRTLAHVGQQRYWYTAAAVSTLAGRVWGSGAEVEVPAALELAYSCLP